MRGPSEGGSHILRSTAVVRKCDRHCKVQTSRGPRDRRMRLSAYTAIQFYDVQDRLGYDRSSKAMEWLMTKAKNAIEKLYESPSSDNDNYNSNESVQTTPGSNSNPSSTPIDHLSLARGSETPTFYQPDNSHVVNNPATYFPGFSGEALPSPLGLPLYALQSDNNEGNSDHLHHTTNLFEEYYMGSKVGFLMSSQEICQQTGVYFQGVPLSNVAMDQQNYHLGGRQSWYIPAPFYKEEETEGQY